MSDENLNQESETGLEELFEGKNPEQQDAQTDKGDDSEDTSAQEVPEEAFLKKLNQETGKNFKSLDDWKKSLQNLEKAVAQKGREVKKEVVTSTPAVIKELFFDKHPEARDYWETVEAEAVKLKKDPFELYLNSTYLRGEAKAKYEAEKQTENSNSKMEIPASGVNVRKQEKENPFMKNFPPGFAANKLTKQ